MKRLAVALLLAAACKNGPSEDQCKQLLDHLVDLEFKAGGAGAATDAMKQELAKSKAAVSEDQIDQMLVRNPQAIFSPS